MILDRERVMNTYLYEDELHKMKTIISKLIQAIISWNIRKNDI